ncbi:MAG: RNA-binding protein [Thaumarchaeota archaeon]|nr:MAG: RNA-binding protein [Nitrososphaerota archaeon]
MSFEQSVRVPLERVGVVIGKGGSTRKSFEEELGVVLSVDSKSGSVVVKCDSIEKGDPMKAVRVVEAIGRGFSPQRAHRLLGEEVAFEVIDLRDFAGKSVNALGRIRGRIIGVNGKSRRVIEELTGCYLSVYGRSVAMIGEPTEMRLAMEAVKMLASGSPHRTVYNMLQKARTKRKMERMLLWEESSPEKMAEKLKELSG